MGVTWKPHEKHGELAERSDLPDTVFAFPRERKEPLIDAQHVRNAIARFDQVIDVSDAERAQATVVAPNGSFLVTIAIESRPPAHLTCRGPEGVRARAYRGVSIANVPR